MKLGFRQKLQFIAIALFIVVAIESFFIIQSQQNIRQSSNQLINKEMSILNAAHQLKLSVVQVQQWLTDISATRAQDGLNDGFDEAKNNADIFKKLITKLIQLDPENSDQYNDMLPIFYNYFSVGKQMAQSYIDEGPAGGNKMMTNFDEAAASMSEIVDGFLQTAIQRAKDQGEIEINEVNTLKTTTIISTIALFLTLFAAFWQGRSLLNFLGHDPETLKFVADNIAHGDLSAHADEANAKGVFESLTVMRKRLQQQLQEITHQANENGRIKTALDNVTSPVIMLDDEEKIIYSNHSAQQLFTSCEKDIQQSISGFQASELLSTSAQTLFPQNAEFLANLVAKKNASQVELYYANSCIKVTSTPVKNENGEVFGTAIELLNRTDELAIEKEIAGIVESAQNGDLSQRLDTFDKTGFFLDLAVGMNALMNQMDDVFSALACVLSKMANGDFSKSLEGNFQGTFATIQTDVNHTLNKLDGVVSQIRHSVSNIQDSTTFIASSNYQLSEGAQKQAASLQQTAAAMEQFTGSVKANADNAEAANSLTGETASIADHGKSVVQEAVHSMAKINESSKKISEIIGVIDEIAFQTNLLALNASVEAARAGEQGRGFAVVATEVRNLAGRSATAAKEIKTLIEDSVEKVESGTQLVNKSGESLGEIVTKIQDIEELISGIAKANREQSSGITDVNNSISIIDSMTQDNAALASRVANTSDEMKDKAADAQSILAFFK